MAFPDTPAALAVELQLGGTWTDVTSRVLVDEKIKIRRGRSSEAQNVDPTTCQLTLDNRDGRFSLRNPSSPYYGQLTRNTPLRVSVTGLDSVSLQLNPGVTDRATVPHAAGQNVGVSGDLDVRVDLTPYDMYGTRDYLAKWDNTTGQMSYVLWQTSQGVLALSWTTGGTAATQQDRYSTVSIPRDNFRRFTVRAVLDTDNGAGGHSVTFYYADSMAGPWRQLGDVLTVAGTTSVWAGTAALAVGRAVASGANTHPGRIYGAQLRVGLGAATLAASPDFTAATAGAASYTDAQGNVWTPQGTAAFSSSNVRFVGEVSTWPVEWDESGRNVRAPITAAGVLRRLQANVPPLRSPFRRSIPALSTLRAYWPLEDGSGATSFAYGLPDPLGQRAAAIGGAASLSSDSGFIASDELPTFTQGSYMRGRVPAYTASGFAQVRMLLGMPATGVPTAGTVLLKVTCTNSVWTITYNGSGNLGLTGTENGGAAGGLANSVLSFGVDGVRQHLSLELTQNGANVDWKVARLVVGASSGTVFSGTGVGVILGVVSSVQAGAAGSNSSVVVGHVTVESTITSLFALSQQLVAYTGEVAIDRARRLANEEGYGMYRQGPPGVGTAMGPQRVATLLDQLRDCAVSELGILYEMRGVASLTFHPRGTLLARDAAVQLPYAGLKVLEPVDDDSALTNDVVLTRELGSTFEAALVSGPLSTAAPPAGVGKYQQAQTVSLANDGLLRDQANMRLALGTIDQPRYPSIGVGLHDPRYYGSAAARELARQVLDADLGDMVQVTGLPSFYAAAVAFQRIEGITEEISGGGRLWHVTFNTSPGDLWRATGVWNDPTARTRWDTDSSTLAAGATSSATTLSVASSDGNLWTTVPAHFPFDVVVSGEQMTVTAVAGTSSPQTFTVTRSINGVSKAQLAGAQVRLASPSYYGFS